jgi:hypothetical protein
MIRCSGKASESLTEHVTEEPLAQAAHERSYLPEQPAVLPDAADGARSLAWAASQKVMAADWQTGPEQESTLEGLPDAPVCYAMQLLLVKQRQRLPRH